MSQWTHIAAIIRFDDLRYTKNSHKLDLGITSIWDHKKSKMSNPLETCNVPCGSEGSLQYYVLENPHLNSISAYVVTFWGDLRDYENEKEILEYFNRITKGKIIRQGVLEIDIEYESIHVYNFNKETEKFEIKNI